MDPDSTTRGGLTAAEPIRQEALSPWGRELREDSYPLSPMQQGMLFHSLQSGESGVDIEQIVCELHHRVNLPALEQAWQRVVARHAVLRSSFCWEGPPEPIQEVHRHVPLAVQHQDWRSLRAPEQRDRLESYLQADRERGFDLTRAPLMRVALFRMAEAEYHLVWTFHHTLLDGRSYPLVLQELFACYDAFCRGEELDLSSPRPYRQYIEWLRQQDLSKAEPFWRKALQRFTAPTPLIAAHASEREIGRPRHREQKARLSAEATSALHSLAQRAELTLNTLVQGAWAILLSRYSGEEDVVFGATRACRRSTVPGAENMVGLFINTLPVRARVEPSASLLPWLKELRAQWVALREWEHTPLAQIQAWSDVPRGTSLFDTLLMFENYHLNSTLRAQGGNWEQREFRLREQSNYPVALCVYAEPELLLQIQYDASRLDDATVARMLEHLKTLLTGMARCPEHRLGDLPLLTDEERYQLLVTWNETSTAYPRDRCIHELFAEQAERAPDRVALAFGAEQLTYGELNARANQLAHGLRQLGVGPEVPVGICVERSLEMVVGLLGILKAGGAYVPLDPAYPGERLAFMIEDTQVPVLLTQQHLAAGLPQQGARVLCLDSGPEVFAGASRENPVSGASPESLAYIIYTSGSTGTPKGTRVPHRGVVRLVRETNYANLSAEQTILQFAPISFDASTFEIWGSLLNGARLAIFPPHTPSLEELGEAVRRYGVTTLWLTAALFHQMVEHQLESLTPLRQLLAGGDVLSAPHVRKALERLEGTRLINGYGPTENTTFTCCHPIASLRPGGSVPIGRPIANTRVYVLDRSMQPVPIGVSGELYIGGDGLARDYVNRPELTAEKLVPDPFGDEPGARLYRTGDLVRYLPDGSIEFLGRFDHQVKIRGFRVELGEIEAMLGQHPAVQQSVVVVRAEESGHKRLVAYAVLGPECAADRAQAAVIAELRAFLKEKLPEYMLPSSFMLLERLPLSPNGKVDRRALPDPGAARPDLEEGAVAPRTPTEELLAGIWAEVLRLERIGIHDNFFELGGDSILSIQIIARANRAGLRFSPRQLFQHPTIAELAAAAGTGALAPADQGVVTGPVPLTPIQIWFFEQGFPAPEQFSQAILLGASSRLDPVLLQRAIDHLLRHHDALRLCFERTESGWEQVNDGPREAEPISRIDLSSLSEVQRANALERIVAELQARLDLTRGPLLGAAIASFGAVEGDQLLLVIHHLAVDGVSWRILLEDLQTIYEQLSRKGPTVTSDRAPLPLKTSSFQRWSCRQAEYARSEAVHQELDEWLSRPYGAVAPLPVERAEAENTVASERVVTVSLTADETRALLQEVPAAYHAQINDVLLTALAQAFQRWTGTTTLLLDLEGHGREALSDDLDVSRTVGWFTTIFPVLLELRGASTSREALNTVKEQVSSLPNRGIGYGLLRYLHPEGQVREKLAALPRAEVSFNYLGQFDPVLPRSSCFARWEWRGLVRAPRQRRSHLLEINALVSGETLSISWSYSEQIHERATIERLAGDFIEGLQSLIRDCRCLDTNGYTPSDFPDVVLSPEQLERVFAEVDFGSD